MASNAFAASRGGASPYSDPLLWEHAKREAVRRLGGRHSARAMQLAGKLYREAGGAYTGPKTASQRSLTKWTAEDWTTATGEKACRETRSGTRCDRYLPRAAWSMLSPEEIAATRRVKLQSKTQYVGNTPKAKAAGQRARGARKARANGAEAYLLPLAFFLPLVPP